MKKYEPWVRYEPEDAPPWTSPPFDPLNCTSPPELFAAGLSRHRYWGWLWERDRQMVMDIMHHHPGLTLGETLHHLWKFGGL